MKAISERQQAKLSKWETAGRRRQEQGPGLAFDLAARLLNEELAMFAPAESNYLSM